MMDVLLRVLGIKRVDAAPSEVQAKADRTIAKVDGIVRQHRDKVADEFRRTEQAMKGRPRVP